MAPARVLTETRDAVTAAGPDGHGVLGRAGHRAGSQVDAEPVLGKAVGVAHWGHLGAHVMTATGLFLQGGPVSVS